MGFDALSKEIAKNCGMEERIIREHFRGIMEQKILGLMAKKTIIGKVQLGGDDWLLAVNSVTNLLQTIAEILDHNTGYSNYPKVPLEIAVGLGEFDRWAQLNGNKLIIENSTVDFLKSNIVKVFTDSYKKQNGKSITSTFILFTYTAFNSLDIWDKVICKKITLTPDLHIFVADASAILKRIQLINFLKTIGTTNDGAYGRIDSIFVAPNEYEAIRALLEKKKIVILIGDPEIGKTYCAIQLMWEYYQKGYIPIWEAGGEPPQRERIRRKISDCQVKQGSVTYYEDIFGKTKFEDREDLRRNIATFLNKVEQTKCRVILSSRENVFTEFEKEKLSQSDLRQYLIQMALMKPSYSKEKMYEMLALWAIQFRCRWLTNNSLARTIIHLATKSLTTPLALKDFASESANYSDIDTLLSIIKNKSMETKSSFAEEIAHMSKECRLFFSLLCLLQPVQPAKIEVLYSDISKTMGLNSEFTNFKV